MIVLVWNPYYGCKVIVLMLRSYNWIFLSNWLLFRVLKKLLRLKSIFKNYKCTPISFIILYLSWSKKHLKTILLLQRKPSGSKFSKAVCEKSKQKVKQTLYKLIQASRFSWKRGLALVQLLLKFFETLLHLLHPQKKL